MSRLSDVLAEEWKASVDEAWDRGTLGMPIPWDDNTGRRGFIMTPTQAAVAVLGKRLLAIVMRAPSDARFTCETGEGGNGECVVCGDYFHEPGCEWAAIVEEARNLR